jgi:hypothetical protein
MRIEVGIVEREGFAAAVIFRVDGGLTLREPTLMWLGKDDKAEIIRQARAVVADLKAHGITVANDHLLDEIR